MEYTPLVIGLIIIFIIARSMKKQTKQENDDALKQKRMQLAELDRLIDNRTIDNSVHLTKIEVKVLDIYEQSGIRIPSDIIEDLRHLNLDNEKEILAYIENQRYFWKLENTKKPYKKGGDK